MTITFPDTVEIIDAIRDAISRATVWTYVAGTYACSTCSLDPFTNTATDSLCSECGGLYWIPVYSGTTISGHVTWGFSEQLGWHSGGQLQEGDCRVQIKYTPANITVIDSTKWVDVDGKRMKVIKRTLRGAKQLNRILVDLIEESD
jgi:hypothetical protein